MEKVESHISKLCLDKNVNIELQEEVPQHVINGVRFLYKQFVKDKPGVILNDPADYEQETQVVLFLNGICKGLDQHLNILILCDNDRLAVWSDCLKKLMHDFDEVAINWPKPSSKKSVYVVTTDRLENYHRREWAVVVVDDDDFLRYKLPATVGYKIFITADDLKENLHKFSQIYKWLYPDRKINFEDFKPNKNKISDILQKRIWFGAFVQDILIRNASSLEQISANTYREVPKQPEPRRLTKKNKDSTGTKIKRTKRKVDEDNTDTPYKKITSTSIDKEANSNICDSKLDVSNNGDDQPNLDVESFIRDQEPLRMEELNDISDIDDQMSQTSEKMDVAEPKLDVDVSDGDSSNGMKLVYSEDVTATSDDAYALETQDNGVDNNDLNFKEVEEFNADVNIVENEVLNIGFNSDTKKSEHDDFALCSEVKDSLSDNKLDSVGARTEYAIQFKDKDNTNSKDEIKKVVAKAEDLDAKWEEMALKKFKGSLLDRIF